MALLNRIGSGLGMTMVYSQGAQPVRPLCSALDRLREPVEEWTPIVSTVIGIAYLFFKAAVIPLLSEDKVRSYALLHKADETSLLRCLVMWVPVLGNLCLYVLDRSYLTSEQGAVVQAVLSHYLSYPERFTALEQLEKGCTAPLWIYGRALERIHCEQIRTELEEQSALDKVIAQRQRYLKMLHKNLDNIDAWVGLAGALGPEETVNVKGVTYTKHSCMLKVVQGCPLESAEDQELSEIQKLLPSRPTSTIGEILSTSQG